MDLGSSRPPQPSDRRVVNSAQPYRQPEEPARTVPEPTTPRNTMQSKAPRNKPSSKRWLVVGGIFLLLAAAVFTWFIFMQQRTAVAGIATDKYQTVYLMNGQIYFGKLTAISDTQYKLSNVYYLQTASTDATKEASSAQTSAANNSQLIKLSNAVYGPEDEMVISKDQVLYFQNLNPEGRAAQLIKTTN